MPPPLFKVRGKVVRASVSGTERLTAGKLTVETGEGNNARTYEIPCDPSTAIELLESDQRYPIVEIEVREVRP